MKFSGNFQIDLAGAVNWQWSDANKKISQKSGRVQLVRYRVDIFDTKEDLLKYDEKASSIRQTTQESIKSRVLLKADLPWSFTDPISSMSLLVLRYKTVVWTLTTTILHTHTHTTNTRLPRGKYKLLVRKDKFRCLFLVHLSPQLGFDVGTDRDATYQTSP